MEVLNRLTACIILVHSSMFLQQIQLLLQRHFLCIVEWNVEMTLLPCKGIYFTFVACHQNK